MAKETKELKIIEGGYQPDSNSQRGYQANKPQASISNANLPRGGTGQSGSSSGQSSSTSSESTSS